MCRAEYAEAVDKAVFPGLQGGPHNHATAAVAVALKEAASGEFREYAARVVSNAKTLAAALSARGFDLVSGGTDNHLQLIDVTTKGLTGHQMARASTQPALSAIATWCRGTRARRAAPAASASARRRSPAGVSVTGRWFSWRTGWNRWRQPGRMVPSNSRGDGSSTGRSPDRWRSCVTASRRPVWTTRRTECEGSRLQG